MYFGGWKSERERTKETEMQREKREKEKWTDFSPLGHSSNAINSKNRDSIKMDAKNWILEGNQLLEPSCAIPVSVLTGTEL